ncbi:hypothetical protein F7725_006996, partial [Dissostichus mawsoni]
MPSDIPAVPTTMRIHQVVTLSLVRFATATSVACVPQMGILNVIAKKPSHSHSMPDDPTEDPNHKTPEVVQWPAVVGKWCALVYDHIIYPGIIQEVNETLPDLHWYPLQDVLTLIPPPENVTSRHMAIAREVWDTLASHE